MLTFHFKIPGGRHIIGFTVKAFKLYIIYMFKLQVAQQQKHSKTLSFR